MPCADLRFLVVEDHEFQRNVLVRLLKSLGAAEVFSAEDGQAALHVIRDPDRPVDIVVSDLSMPGMDGMEFIRHLSEADAHVSLIVASALDTDVVLAIANMARLYKVRLLGAIGKPPTATNIVPLIELYKSAGNIVIQRDLSELDGVADAWKRNEFEPWFEPRVDLTTGAVCGLDVTARWRRPGHGIVLAQDFLPAMRVLGLNDDFVWLLLQRAIAQCKTLQRPDRELKVAVNLGFDSLTDPNIAARVRQVAEKESVKPSLLTFTVTESALNTDSAKALENLARLRVDGFGLGIDDFGTGQMAAEQISLVAFTELKIRSAFVAGIEADDSAKAGLAVGLEIAQKLRLKTIATGIRSNNDLKLLRDWGCDYGQGPFVSEPIHGDAVPDWVSGWAGLSETVR